MSKYMFIIIFVFIGCEKEQGKKAILQQKPIKKERSFHKHDVVVDEVLQTTKYTYFRFKLHNNDTWAAVTKRKMKAGDIYPFEGGSEMNNFKSKELNRTFESILFISDRNQHNHPVEEKKQHAGKPKTKEISKKVPKANNGITIAELYKDLKNYNGKTVKVRGEVTKFNALILNTNWIHIQDGTKHNGLYDLTITSKANVKVGDIIVIEGKVVLNKDFGHGYKYDVLIENAQRVQ